MFVIQMLNSNNEWELCGYVFDSRAAAESFAAQHLDMFDEHMITEMKKY